MHCLPVLIQVCLGVMQVRAVLFEKSVDFHPGIESKQASHLKFRETLIAVSFRGKSLKSQTRNFLAGLP